MANGLVTLRDAPASETLRTMHGTALPPNSIIPGFRTFSREAVRWFSIGYSLLIRAESSGNRIARTVIVYGASRCGLAQLRDASRFRRALSVDCRGGAEEPAEALRVNGISDFKGLHCRNHRIRPRTAVLRVFPTCS